MSFFVSVGFVNDLQYFPICFRVQKIHTIKKIFISISQKLTTCIADYQSSSRRKRLQLCIKYLTQFTYLPSFIQTFWTSSDNYRDDMVVLNLFDSIVSFRGIVSHITVFSFGTYRTYKHILQIKK